MNDLLNVASLPLAIAILKGTIVVAVPMLFVRPLSRTISAAWRHGIVMASLVAFACVMAMSIFAPAMRWRILPRGESATASSTWGDSAPLPSYTSARGDVAAASPSPGEQPAQSSGVAVLGVIWLAGTALLLGRILAVVIFATRRRRSAIPVSSRSWLGLLQECKATLGNDRSVELLLADDVSSPFLWGLFRPAIVFPTSALEWGSARQRIVLLHELAHLNRRDVEFAFAAQVILAMFWWNPVLWLATREAEEAREMAADDVALRAGVNPGAYVAEIVELVRYSRRAAIYPAFSEGAMSRFERRMTRALTERTTRAGMTRNGTALLAGGALLAGCTTAMLTPRDQAMTLGETGCSYDGGRHLDVGRKLPDGRAVWRVEWSGRGCQVRAEFLGAATYDVATRRVVVPGIADTFRLRMEHGARSDSLVVTRGAGADGYSITSSARQQVDLTRIVTELEQHTGFGAPDRVPPLLREGGYAAVLAEARSMQIDHAVGRYLTEALRAQEPTLEEMHPVLGLAAERVTNEYQLVALLQAAAPHRALGNPSARSAYQRAAETLQTSAGRRAALATLDEYHPTTH